jgi:hypothetical protein
VRERDLEEDDSDDNRVVAIEESVSQDLRGVSREVDAGIGEGDGGHAHLDVPHPDSGARVLENLLEVDSSEARQDRSHHHSNESNEGLAVVLRSGGGHHGGSGGGVLCDGDSDSEQDEGGPSERE